MEMIPVDSTDLEEIGYDADTNTLVIEFKRGNVYKYNDVPQAVYDGLMSADSVGKYFNQFIKRNYGYSKI